MLIKKGKDPNSNFIKDLRYKRNVSDSQVRNLSKEEVYEDCSPLGKAQWKYEGFHMKPLGREIKYTPPKDPKCTVCLDKGSVWIALDRPGCSRSYPCECQASQAS